MWSTPGIQCFQMLIKQLGSWKDPLNLASLKQQSTQLFVNQCLTTSLSNTSMAD